MYLQELCRYVIIAALVILNREAGASEFTPLHNGLPTHIKVIPIQEPLRILTKTVGSTSTPVDSSTASPLEPSPAPAPATQPVAIAPPPTPAEPEGNATGRQGRFLSYSKFNHLETNKLDEKMGINSVHKDTDDPSSALAGMYSDCLLQLSFSCVQKKVLVFLDRLGRLDKFLLIGDFLSVVRKEERAAPKPPPTTPPLSERALDAALEGSQSSLDPLLDHTFERFVESHALRLRIPPWSGEGEGTHVDITVPANDVEGRGKKKKGMKKMLMMMGMMMMGKLAMMLPMMLILAKIKAAKALLMATLALLLSKIQLFKKLLMSKQSGGGGGEEKHIVVLHADGHGGGGGGGHGGGDSYGPPSGGGGGGGWAAAGGHGGGGGGGGGGHSESYGPPSSGGWSGGGGGGGWSSGGSYRSARSVGEADWLAYRGYAPPAPADTTARRR